MSVQQQWVPSAARTASGVGTDIDLDAGNFVCVGVNVTAATGGGTLTCSLTWSHDGANYAPGETATAFAAITAVKQSTLRVQPQAPYCRLEWTISGGTTPSFTFGSYVWTG